MHDLKVSGHPFFFTWTDQRNAKPWNITGGDGAWFIVNHSERWLDMGSLIYQANLGHNDPRMLKALKDQVDRQCLTMPAAVFPEKQELARRLLAIAPPGFTKVFFTLGGAEANENAMKFARAVTGRHKMISRYRSYHGATMGAGMLTGDWRRTAVEPGVPGVVHVNDLDATSGMTGRTQIPRVLDFEGPESVAAVFLESVVGGNGVLIPDAAYMREVREACDKHGTLLVMDEVLTGFGRTGRWFALEHFGVSPDIITCGKGLTGGYGVLGAVLVHERVASHFDDNVLSAGLTHYAHPLGIAAGLEALRCYEDDKLIERADGMAQGFAKGLSDIAAAHPGVVTDVRSIGLLGGIQLALEPNQWKTLKAALHARCVHAHVQANAETLILSPPLNIEQADLEQGFKWVSESIAEAHR